MENSLGRSQPGRAGVSILAKKHGEGKKSVLQADLPRARMKLFVGYRAVAAPQNPDGLVYVPIH